MRYRITNSKETQLGQVLTPPTLALRLAQFFSGNAKTWLELGVGSGRIANACIQSHEPKQYLGIDIDLDLMNSCTKHHCSELVHANVLNTTILNHIIGDQKFDCVVGNPPYGSSQISIQNQQRLRQLCPGITQNSTWAQLDLFFVLESLSKLNRPGQAAFIVSSTLIDDANLQSFRHQLLSEASEIQAYELPLTTFKGHAEVQSFLLSVRYTSSKENNCKIIIGKIDGEKFDIVDQQVISHNAAILSLNLAHHKFLDLDSSLRQQHGCVTLKELGVKIIRGSKSKSEFNDLGIRHFHVSDFPKYSNRIDLPSNIDNRFKLTDPGDILIPRVGSRCLNRQVIVTTGSIPFTDSIYRLQLPSSSREGVLRWLGSPQGLNWRQCAAKGSCAKYLTLERLISMPVLI